MYVCSYCGREDRTGAEMTRVKVGVGPDLYFCSVERNYPDPCAVEVASQLVNVRIQYRLEAS